VTNRKTPEEYFKVKVQTAHRTELLLMLFDGAVRFTTQAKGHMARSEFEDKNRLFIKAQNILLELIQALDPKVGEALYKNLIGLYRFCYERLVSANFKNDAAAADEALRILEHLRETWRLAVKKYHEERAAAKPESADEHICVEG
jgi:flagellar secretion chaperone FliS